MVVVQSIQNRIYNIRDEKVMLDFDLADLYEVGTKVLNQAVKRNPLRFPEDFMFRLSPEEWVDIKPQINTSDNRQNVKWSQIVTSSQGKKANAPDIVIISSAQNRPSKNTPYAFTEHGIAMLSGVLHSEKAIKMNIAIMRAFIAIKQLTIKQMDIFQQIKEIKDRLGEHDTQLTALYDAMDNLLDEDSAKKKWENRQRIGFKS